MDTYKTRILFDALARRAGEIIPGPDLVIRAKGDEC
jgi:hypothetical protein